MTAQRARRDGRRAPRKGGAMHPASRRLANRRWRVTMGDWSVSWPPLKEKEHARTQEKASCEETAATGTSRLSVQDHAAGLSAGDLAADIASGRQHGCTARGDSDGDGLDQLAFAPVRDP